jgi:hypothetical protein
MTLEITYTSNTQLTRPLTLDEIANLISLSVKSHSTDELDVLNYHWEADYTVDNGSLRPPIQRVP